MKVIFKKHVFIKADWNKEFLRRIGLAVSIACHNALLNDLDEITVELEENARLP
jgi:hypothetical protein